MTYLLIFGALGILTLVVTLWRTDGGLIDLITIPFPLAVILFALIGGAALFGAVSGEPTVEPNSPGAAALLASIVGVYSFVTASLLWREDRKLVASVAERRARMARLEAHGVALPATVTAFERTGLSINDIPQLAVTVSATLDGRPITVSRTRLVDPLHAVHVAAGAAACVVIDPGDPTNCELYLGYEESPLSEASSVLARQQALLDRLNETGLVGIATIHACERQPIDIGDVGTMLKLGATVQPADDTRTPGAPFEAELLAAVALERLDRYQPGRTIWVRYDAADRSQVALDFARQDGRAVTL